MLSIATSPACLGQRAGLSTNGQPRPAIRRSWLLSSSAGDSRDLCKRRLFWLLTGAPGPANSGSYTNPLIAAGLTRWTLFRCGLIRKCHARRELRDLYPAHWRELSRCVRFERAHGRPRLRPAAWCHRTLAAGRAMVRSRAKYLARSTRPPSSLARPRADGPDAADDARRARRRAPGSRAGLPDQCLAVAFYVSRRSAEHGTLRCRMT